MRFSFCSISLLCLLTTGIPLQSSFFVIRINQHKKYTKSPLWQLGDKFSIKIVIFYNIRLCTIIMIVMVNMLQKQSFFVTQYQPPAQEVHQVVLLGVGDVNIDAVQLLTTEGERTAQKATKISIPGHRKNEVGYF